MVSNLQYVSTVDLKIVAWCVCGMEKHDRIIYI